MASVDDHGEMELQLFFAQGVDAWPHVAQPGVGTGLGTLADMETVAPLADGARPPPGGARRSGRATAAARSRRGSSARASTATSRRTPTTTRPRTSRATTRRGSASSRRCCGTAVVVEGPSGDVVAPGTIVEIRMEGDDEHHLVPRRLHRGAQRRRSRCCRPRRRSARRCSGTRPATPSATRARAARSRSRSSASGTAS